MADALDVAFTHAFLIAALARLGERGLLDAPAPDEDGLARACQAMLIEGGLLAHDPIEPSLALRDALPPGTTGDVIGGMMRDHLAFITRFASGAIPGWAETDPELIRVRGRASGQYVGGNLLPAALAGHPDVARRLDEPGGVFLDVGVGAAGIAIEMCRRHPSLDVVGLDVSEVALAIARADVTAAGLDTRIEVRTQSVADLSDVGAFDLMWLPQLFIPRDVLRTALPRLAKAGRPGALLVMALSTNDESGLTWHAQEIANLMAGGGTLPPEAAATMAREAGFVSATVVDHGGAKLIVATA